MGTDASEEEMDYSQQVTFEEDEAGEDTGKLQEVTEEAGEGLPEAAP